MPNYRFIVIIALLSAFISSATLSIAGVKEDAEEIVAYCKSTAKDKEQAFSCLEKKAKNAKPEVDYAIASIHYKEGHVNKAVASLKRAARKGYTEAKMELARLYFSDGPHKSCDKSIQWFKEAVQDGSDTARIRLANIYIFNKCDSGSPEEAYELLIPIAEKGNANAQLTVGLMYKDGIGVMQDADKSRYWLSEAENSTNSKVSAIAKKALSKL